MKTDRKYQELFIQEELLVAAVEDIMVEQPDMQEHHLSISRISIIVQV